MSKCLLIFIFLDNFPVLILGAFTHLFTLVVRVPTNVLCMLYINTIFMPQPIN